MCSSDLQHTQHQLPSRGGSDGTEVGAACAGLEPVAVDLLSAGVAVAAVRITNRSRDLDVPIRRGLERNPVERVV